MKPAKDLTRQEVDAELRSLAYLVPLLIDRMAELEERVEEIADEEQWGVSDDAESGGE